MSQSNPQYQKMTNILQVVRHEAGFPCHGDGELNFYRTAELREARRRLKERMETGGYLPRIQTDPSPFGYIEDIWTKVHPNYFESNNAGES